MASSPNSPSGGGVLVGSLQAKAVPLASVAATLATVLLSYAIATSLGHVPVWLPMISDCAVEAPEMFVFRYGMIVSAVVLGLNVFVVYNATKASYSLPRVCSGLGAVAAFSLGMLTVVNEDEDNSVHSSFAVVFFFAYNVYMLIISKNSSSDLRVSVSSLNIKRTTSVLLFFDLIVFVLMSFHWTKYKVAIAVAEWLGFIFIEIFNLTFIGDLGYTRVEEVTAMSIAAIKMLPRQESQSEWGFA